MTHPAAPATSVALTEATARTVRELLLKKPLWYRLPAPLAQGLVVQRQHEFQTIAVMGGPLVYLLFGVIAAVLSLQFGSAAFHGWNAQVIWTFLAFNTVGITIGMGISRIPAMRAHYLWLVFINGALQLASPLAASMLLTDPLMQRGMSYVVIYFVCFVMVVLRAPVLLAGLTCVAGLLEAITVAYWLGGAPDWVQLVDYYAGAVFVAGAIALVMERLERLSYLRGTLLEYESAEKSRLLALLEQESAEISRLNAVLATLAAQDQLSGLANRRQFDGVLKAEWERAQRQQTALALLFIDVDYFKRYNDTYGHAAGDQCLQAVATALQGCTLRPADLVARYGGEEFVILLPDTALTGALEVAGRALAGIDALALAHAASDAAPFVTVSIGLAVQEKGRGSTAELLERADKALYAAKANGRHGVQVAP